MPFIMSLIYIIVVLACILGPALAFMALIVGAP